MKKLNALIVVAILLIAGNASAQIKIAYIHIDDIVGAMPELAPSKVNMDTVGNQYLKDSIMPRLNYVQSEYQRKLQEYADTTKPKSVRDQILKDLQNYKDELDGADALIQQVQQFMQQKFLEPYYTKARKAVDQVAKEKGYTHVMTTEAFLVAPPADNISSLVFAKLGIKPPNQNPPPKTGGN